MIVLPDSCPQTTYALNVPERVDGRKVLRVGEKCLMRRAYILYLGRLPGDAPGQNAMCFWIP